MHIKKLTTLGLDRLADLELDLTHPKTGKPADVVLITGPMASGKTTLIESVFVARDGAVLGAPSGPWQPDGRDGGAAKIILTWELDDMLLGRFPGDAERELEAIFDDDRFPCGNDPVFEFALRDEAQPWGRLEYFHANRRGASLDGFAVRPSRSAKRGDKYAGTCDFIAELVIADDGRLQRLNDALGAAGTSIIVSGAERIAQSYVPRIATSRSSTRGLDDLSDGERDVLLMLTTALRFDLGAAPIFIDVPELAVGFDDAPRLLEVLREQTGAQLICATRDATPYRSLPGSIAVNCRGGVS